MICLKILGNMALLETQEKELQQGNEGLTIALVITCRTGHRVQ